MDDGMKIVLLSYYYEGDLKDGEALIDRYHTLSGWAGGLHREGADVTVIHRFHTSQTLEREGVRYQFISDRYGPRLRPWQIPRDVHRQVRAVQPSLIHIHGLFFALQARSLRKTLSETPAIVIQHHAEMPCQGMRGWIQQFGLKNADAFLFASREIGQIWADRGIIAAMEKVFPVMEGSTHFKRRDRRAARKKTELSGDPVFLWVGRLNGNKDPLTVLSAFDQILAEKPTAKLFMIYSSEELLPQVASKIKESPRLHGTVHLLGKYPRSALEDFYNSADFFILGSHYEGSGYALAEALACGLVPVVTDIPSFRMMTDGGKIGALWQPGDTGACADAIRRVNQRPLSGQADAAHRFFLESLSYPAIAHRVMKIYQAVISKRRRNL